MMKKLGQCCFLIGYDSICNKISSKLGFRVNVRIQFELMIHRIPRLFCWFFADVGKKWVYLRRNNGFFSDRTMEYISVKQFAEKFNVSERTVRNYCASRKIDDAYLIEEIVEHTRTHSLRSH